MGEHWTEGIVVGQVKYVDVEPCRLAVRGNVTKLSVEIPFVQYHMYVNDL